MRKKIEWQWEVLDNHGGNSVTSRAQVIGGWLVHHAFTTPKGMMSESMVFVPDTNHYWTISQLPKEQIPAEKAGTNWEDPKAS